MPPIFLIFPILALITGPVVLVLGLLVHLVVLRTPFIKRFSPGWWGFIVESPVIDIFPWSAVLVIFILVPFPLWLVLFML
jgi:hypothetical protein